MAAGPAPGGDFPEDRALAAAAWHRMRAARVKMAAGRRIERRGDLALHRMIAALAQVDARHLRQQRLRSEENTSELQSLMRISYPVSCLKKKKHKTIHPHQDNT